MKSSCAVALLGVFSIFFVCTQSTTAEQSKETNYENTDHNDIEITLDQAKELCQKLHDSRIQTDHTYLWVPVESTQQQPQPATPTLTPGCLTAKYIGCKGEPQFPISEQCGFFTLVPKTDCSSAGTGNERSRRSTSAQQKLSLTYGKATQLCASIKNLPEDLTFQIKYIPIRIHLTPKENSIHLSDSCITWTNEPCADNEEQTAECGTWKFHIGSSPKCSPYSEFQLRYNSSHLARFPNPMAQKTDFLINEDVTQGDLSTGMDKLLSDKIKCTRDGPSITCIVTKNGDRSKRATTPLMPVTRVKRACCGLHRCGRCGLARMYGNRQFEECDCSNNVDDYCQNMGACDMAMYPSGCFGNCLF